MAITRRGRFLFLMAGPVLSVGLSLGGVLQVGTGGGTGC